MFVPRRRRQSGGSSSTTDPDAAAYWTAAGISNSSERSAINTLFLGLKSNSLFSKLNRLYLVSPTSSSAARYCAITLTQLTDLGGVCGVPSYHSATGWTVGASNGGFDTGFIPNHGANASSLLTSATGHLCVYNPNGGGFGVFLGCDDGNVYCSISQSCGLQANICTNSGHVPNIVTCSTTGFFIISRQDVDDVRFYIDGVENASTLGPMSGDTPPNEHLYIGGMNDNGVPSDFNDYDFRFGSIGAGFDPTDAANFTSLAQTYLSAVGHL